MIPPLGPAARARRAAVREREELAVERLESLAPALDGEPDLAFREATRARLVAMAAVRQPAAEPESTLQRVLTSVPAAPAPWRGRLTAGLAGASLTVTVLAGAVALSVGAGPGDLLYDVKRGTEATQLALASDARYGETLLEFASTRLTELEDLLRGGEADPALVEETLAAMDEQTREGAAWQAQRALETSDPAPLEALTAWSDDQSEGLVALRAAIPASAEQEYGESLALLDAVGLRAAGLETTLGCATGPVTVGADDLGPVPAACTPTEASESGSSGGGAPGAPGGAGSDPSTGSGSGGVAPGSPGGGDSGSPGTGGTAGSGSGGTGGTGGGLPTGPDTPVGTPELPAGDGPLPLPPVEPTLPSVPGLPGVPDVPLPGPGGLLPGQETAPSSSSDDGLLCVPTLDLPTC